jgi:hypothetical protein
MVTSSITYVINGTPSQDFATAERSFGVICGTPFFRRLIINTDLDIHSNLCSHASYPAVRIINVNGVFKVPKFASVKLSPFVYCITTTHSWKYHRVLPSVVFQIKVER